MYAVGRLGSYISQGVYTVSGPFHPFGGAVDIVVVQQQDGSLKSSPWYVRFGKFQGVLKAKVRVVDINVNGVDAGFHMYLDPRGEAYFLREVDSEEAEAASSCSSKSVNYEFDRCNSARDVSNGALVSRTDSKRSRILGFVLGKRSMKEENGSNIGRKTSLETAEIAADLLEMKWSTNLSSRTDSGEIMGGRLEASLVLHEEHFVNTLEDSRVDHEVPPMEVDETVVTDDVSCVSKDIDESSRTQIDDTKEPEVGLITGQGSLKIISESYTEVATDQADASIEVSCQKIDDNLEKEVDETNEIRPLLESDGDFQVSEQYVEEQLIFGDLDDANPSINKIEHEVKHAGSESTSVMYSPDQLTVSTYQEHSKDDLEGLIGDIRKCPSNLDFSRSCEVPEAEDGRHAKSLPNMWCQFDDPVPDNHDDPQSDRSVGKLKASKWDLLRDDASRIKKANVGKELAPNADSLPNDLKDGSIASGGPPGIGDGGSGRWRMWPFRRLGSKNVSENGKKDSDVSAVAETNVDTVAETNVEKERCSPKSNKKQIRTLTPTPEQLASLNLAEGQNTVTFTFSTSVLGTQKVDARIYLWRWDTRIVISDVDGTITKSDVLGQFMPLVGRDWSHIGVTPLFSAIKENGYQMLYLSARAISQASITKQFLFNLKQDGKALPDGPVVISPDGLFPSLFREVIRRVPHEFKIACLEDIKVCFPSDRNPFYAGFGNRHTDEFSYLKVGIPKGKIFIINSKGEVVINRSIDSRSYSSLHSLVNRIFPPVSGHEEEDYNSWNFWKLPPPTIE
ncbi:putative phosphatidate phosphatase [Helianthus annuus]|uniref:Phosphatidate phosphatase n=1 Tax=Helianthus annuus TaxID=4232 RepID=A0A251SH55_HELAN|nr:phosphatidate phosphatase PAH2 isoform X2 [Helianthus annuus]KAF5758963.1 putative phosphatidate phosphatase [Helianthus annuus]KAJ0437227.1 putative phosphatidate phosphatase [Helianthus annuus]KAJ0459550.1 putative phosphatidate phosphatase [Helianthus annuus]